MWGVRSSSPDAFSEFNFDSCSETQFVFIVMSGMFGNLELRGRTNSARCCHLKDTILMKTG